ncbi:MAG: ribonuclease H-like domain-containing protein [bacterium]
MMEDLKDNIDTVFYEYQEALQLKLRLLEEYQGKNLTQVIPGRIVENDRGTYYHIETEFQYQLKTIQPDYIKEKILSDLKLISGIGEATELFLKESGYQTIEDLTGHPRFKTEAKGFLEIFNRCDLYHLIKWIERWFPKSHPYVIFCSGLHDKNHFLVLDIETQGIFKRPIILIGFAIISGSKINVHQYFTRNTHEEPAVLQGFLSHIHQDTIFITFNGRTFDIPYIRERLAFHRVIGDMEMPHIDVLPFSRRAWKKDLPNCRLTTLEKYLFGLNRKDDVPSALVPEFYTEYLKTRNIGPIIPIIEHNRQDVLSLANIFSRLHELWE